MSEDSKNSTGSDQAKASTKSADARKREAQKAAEKNARIMRGEQSRSVRFGLIGLGVVAVVAAIVFFVMHGSGGGAVEGPRGAGADTGYEYVPDTVDENAPKPEHTLVKYVDLQCPGCAELERKTSYGVDYLAQQGKVKVEYRVVSFLDRASKNNYSSRAANAVACVYEKDPKKAATMVGNLLATQPEEGTEGPSDEVLDYFAQSIGVKDAKDCITSGKWNDWVKYVSKESDLEHTPTITLDGEVLDVSQEDPMTVITKALAGK